MKLLSLLALSSPLLVWAITQVPDHPLVKKHVETLQTAKGLQVTFTVARVPNPPAAYTLSFSREGMFRIDSPDKLTVSDGKTMWVYDKKAKQYTEGPAGLEPVQAEELLAWAPFFQKEPYKGARATSGGKRNLKGKDVQEVVLQLGETRTATLFINSEIGVPQGALIKSGGTETLVIASDVTLSEEPLPATRFAFVAPAGATKFDAKAAAQSVTWAQIDPIFRRSCANCHNPGNARGGFDSSSYASVVRGSYVIPGNPAGSTVLQYIKGSRQPRMPRGAAPLPQQQIDLIEAWIQAGAKQ